MQIEHAKCEQVCQIQYLLLMFIKEACYVSRWCPIRGLDNQESNKGTKRSKSTKKFLFEVAARFEIHNAHYRP
jgi:hypothetical protein